MELKKRGGIVNKLLIFGILFIIINTNIVSAGFFDKAKAFISGEVTQPQSVSLTVANSAPVITVGSITVDDDGIAPFDDSVVLTPDNLANPAYVSFSVSDPDGGADVDVTQGASVTIIFSKTGEDNRIGSCTGAPTLSGNLATYTLTDCLVNMKYYDAFGLWNVQITVEDANPALASDTKTETNSFTVQKLTSFAINSPITLSWGSIGLGTKNQPANTPAVLRNNGNDPGNEVQVTGKNLLGTTDSTRGILVSDFSANTAAVCPTTPNLVHNVAQTIINSPGNALIVGSDATPNPTQNLNFCLEQVTNPGVNLNPVTQQTYSTAPPSSPWDIIFTAST